MLTIEKAPPVLFKGQHIYKGVNEVRKAQEVMQRLRLVSVELSSFLGLMEQGKGVLAPRRTQMCPDKATLESRDPSSGTQPPSIQSSEDPHSPNPTRTRQQKNPVGLI